MTKTDDSLASSVLYWPNTNTQNIRKSTEFWRRVCESWREVLWGVSSATFVAHYTSAEGCSLSSEPDYKFLGPVWIVSSGGEQVKEGVNKPG